MNLEKLKSNIEKKAKGVHVSRLSESTIATSHDFIKTQALDLNRILSGSLYGGIPSKGMVCIAGEEHTGKSSFMVLTMAEAQKKGYTPIILDTEGGITDAFCRRWNLDPENCLYVYSPFVEELFPVLAQIKESEEGKFIIGLDSIGGLESYKLVDDSIKGEAKHDQGQLARWIRRLLRLILNISVSKESVSILTAHMYASPDLYTKDSVGGGKAVRLFPNIIILLKKREMVEGTGTDKKVIGTKVTATTIKNRWYPPFQQATIDIDYIKGIDEYAGILELCVEAGLITKSGGGFYKDLDGNVLARGYEEARNVLKSELPKMAVKVDEWLKTTGYSTVNKEVERMVQILEEAEKDNQDIEENINIDEEEKSKKRKTKK